MQSSDADNEGKGLSAVSMTQEYTWLGLADGDDASDKPAATASSGGFFLQDLILWKVLGFALDVDSYLNLCLVCKEWNRMVKLREPPVMMKIARLLLNNNENRKPISADKIELLTTVFAMLQNRECALYRKSPPPQDDLPQGRDSSSAKPCCWPSIQPHFNVLLMKFAYDLCTQRSPHNHLALLYQATTGFLDQLASETAEKVWPTSTILTSIDRSSSGSDSNNDPFVELQRVVDAYNTWEGTVDAVEGIVGYLNRYYVKHHSLLTIRKQAYNSMASSRLTTTRKLVHLFRQLEQAVATTTGSAGSSSDGSSSSLPTWNTAENRSLLLRVSRIAQSVSSMWTSTELNTRQEDFAAITEAYRKILTAFEPLLEQAAEEEQSLQKQAQQQQPAAVAEKPLTIVSPEGQRFSLPRSSRFVQESELLCRLRLQPGDVVKLLGIKTTWIDKAMAFYSIERPFPGIPMPHNPQLSMREIVGDDYAEFVTSMEDEGLFGLVNFANLLGWKSPLDLCCCEVARRIRGKSAAQLRAMFALQDN